MTRVVWFHDGGSAHAGAVPAIKIKPLRGRYANLDRSARRRLFGFHGSLVREAARQPRRAPKETWRRLAAPTGRSHAEGAEAKRRSGEAA